MPATRRFQFILSSARPDGNSEYLARVAAKTLPSGAEAHWFDLSKNILPPYRDRRHEEGYTFNQPAGIEGEAFALTLAATDIVMVVPLYWYGVPSAAKLYLDYWADWLRVPGADFKARMAGKIMWGVSAVSDPDPTLAEPLAGTLRYSARFLKMQWGGVLYGLGSKPGDVKGDKKAHADAERFFQRNPETA